MSKRKIRQNYSDKIFMELPVAYGIINAGISPETFKGKYQVSVWSIDDIVICNVVLSQILGL